MDSDKKISISNNQNSFEITSFFDKDSDFVFVFKKTEKLVTAVYLITNLFPESEPMKHTLRLKSTDLLSYVVGYKDVVGSQKIEFTNSVRTRILEIVTHLEIASHAGLVSPMNLEILKQEFFKLSTALDTSPVRTEKSAPILSADFFDQTSDTTTSTVAPLVTQQVPHIPTRNTVFSASVQMNQIHSNRTSDVKDSVNVFNKTAVKKSSRQEIILDLLKKNKELTIKDISEVIQDCSEKTIQRELISLIAAKVIKKTGERRWSRYSLISE